MTIPVVDFGDLGAHIEDDVLVRNCRDFERVSKELDTALSTVGFVYLKNHGVQQELVGFI